VETPAQMQRLADRGCRFMQGFLFSRPVPPDQFAQLLAQGSRSDWCASAGQCPPPADGGEGATGEAGRARDAGADRRGDRSPRASNCWPSAESFRRPRPSPTLSGKARMRNRAPWGRPCVEEHGRRPGPSEPDVAAGSGADAAGRPRAPVGRGARRDRPRAAASARRRRRRLAIDGAGNPEAVRCAACELDARPQARFDRSCDRGRCRRSLGGTGPAAAPGRILGTRNGPGPGRAGCGRSRGRARRAAGIRACSGRSGRGL